MGDEGVRAAARLEGGDLEVSAGERVHRREGAVRMHPEQVGGVGSGDDCMRDSAHVKGVDSPGICRRVIDGAQAGLRRLREGAVFVHSDYLDSAVAGRGHHRIRAVSDGNGVDASDAGCLELPGRDQASGGVVEYHVAGAGQRARAAGGGQVQADRVAVHVTDVAGKGVCPCVL